MLSISAVASRVVVGRRGVATVFLAAWILCGCGGGSGDSSTNPATNPSTADATKVATSVDSSLQGTGALAVASSLSVFDKQPAGSPVSAQAGTVVYGLDAAGNVALAGNVVDAKVAFSAAGTVLAMGATVLQGIVPTATQEQLQARLKAADGYASLVTAVQSAVLAGKNPLDQAAVQQGFDTVLASAARAAVQAQSVQTGTARALAVAPTHALDASEPPVFERSTFKVVLANKSSNTPKFDSAVLFRNTSTLTFDVALLDDSGFQRTADVLNGSGPTIFTLQGALAQTVKKPFAGSFSVRLSLNEELTQISFVKEILEIPKVFGSTCVSGLATGAVKQVLSQLTNVTFKLEPEKWGLTAVDMAWEDFKSCGVPLITKSSVLKIIEVYFKITKIVGVGRFIADTLALPPTIPDTGVCLSQTQSQMSCLSSIAADAIKPMMPGAVQPINVLMLDEAGKKTLAPPYGLKIEYSNPGLFELSSTMTTVNSNFNNVEGTGTFKITDPATDKTFSRSVTVTNGKLERTAYTVPPNGTVDVTLVDPASGSEVYRGAAFDIYVADGSFGSFTPFKTTGLGTLTFHASSVVTPAPQPIRLNGAKDSGATMTVSDACPPNVDRTFILSPGQSASYKWSVSSPPNSGEINLASDVKPFVWMYLQPEGGQYAPDFSTARTLVRLDISDLVTYTSNPSLDFLGFNPEGWKGVGSYSLVNGFNGGLFSIYPNGVFFARPGELLVTNVQKTCSAPDNHAVFRVEGTFYGQFVLGSSTATVSDGRFAANLYACTIGYKAKFISTSYFSCVLQ